MQVGLISQPYRDSASAFSFMAEALQDPAISRCLIVTAWVRESGLRLIEEDLRQLRARGGSVDFFVGVDLRASTIQGLNMAKQLASSIRVVHDPSGPTFHPKMYLMDGPTSGYALVGSSNLTGGGMFFNYEAAMAMSFVASERPGFVGEIERFADRLVEDKPICKRLTPRVLSRLIVDGFVVDETKDRRHRREDRVPSGRSGGDGVAPLFGKSLFEKRSKPPTLRSHASAANSKSSTGPRQTKRQARAPLSLDAWWKKLGPGDAQRSPQGHLTGVVRLTPPQGVRNRARFFRREFFKDEHWKPRRDRRGNRLEVTEIMASVSIDGESLGERPITIDYGAFRNERGRATTVMHWGDLKRDLSERDVTDFYLLVERGPHAYALSLVRKRPR